MENNLITNKDIIGWVVTVSVSLVPLLIFYLQYRIDKKKANKKIENLEEMIYKQEIALKEEIIKRKDLEIKNLQNEIQRLKKELTKKEGTENHN